LDAATGNGTLVSGRKVLSVVYGTLAGDVPMKATMTVRWSLTLPRDGTTPRRAEDHNKTIKD